MFEFVYTLLKDFLGEKQVEKEPIKPATPEERKRGEDLQKDVIENKYYAWWYDYKTETVQIIDYSKSLFKNNTLSPKGDYDAMNAAMIAIHENAVRREIVKYQIDSKGKTNQLFYDVMKNVLNKTNELIEEWMQMNSVIIVSTKPKIILNNIDPNQDTLEYIIRRNETGKEFDQIGFTNTNSDNSSTTAKRDIEEGDYTKLDLQEMLREEMLGKPSDDYSKILKTWCDGVDQNDIDKSMTKNFTNMVKFRLATLTELDDTGNDMLTYDKILPYERDAHINDIESHFDELLQLVKIWWQSLYNGYPDPQRENPHNVYDSFIRPLMDPKIQDGIQTYEKNLEKALKSYFPFGPIEDMNDYLANVRRTMKMFKKMDRLTALPSETITNTVMHGPILSYKDGWCIGESASIVQQAIDLCRLICNHSLEYSIQEPAYILHKLFLGWEHSTIRASRRTVHAILCGKLRETVMDYYKNYSFHAIDPRVFINNEEELESLKEYYKKINVKINNNKLEITSNTQYVLDKSIFQKPKDAQLLFDACKAMTGALHSKDEYYLPPDIVLQNIIWLNNNEHNIFWFEGGNLVTDKNLQKGQKNEWLGKFISYVEESQTRKIKNLEKKIKETQEKQPKNKINYELLQSLKETPANNLPPLVSYAPVVIHGPRPNAVATQCFIQEILILTEEGKRIRNLLESTVEDVMKTSRVTSTPVGCLAYEHRQEQRQHKRARTIIDFDRILDHWKLNLTAVVSTMNNLQLTHSISSDAGRIQRNMHSLENLKLQLALSIKQLIYTIPPTNK